MYTVCDMPINDPVMEGTVSTQSTPYNMYSPCVTENFPAHGIDVVTPIDDFAELPPSKKFIEFVEYVMNARKYSIGPKETCSFEKPSISSSLNNVVISSEVKRINNKSFDRLLNSILSEIYFQLSEYEINENAKINVEIARDIEIPEWDEFVISIELPSINRLSYEEYFAIWEKIDENIRDRIDLTEVEDKEILEKYGMPIIILEECE